MIKQITVLLVLFCTLIVSPASAEITSKDTKKSATGKTLEVTYYDGDKEIAKRSYKEKAGKLEIDPGILKGSLPDGVVRSYYGDGKIEYEVVYKDNKREGLRREYYNSGTLKAETYYKNDRPEGISRSYYENGRLKVELPIPKEGVNEGVVYLYSEDGAHGKATYKNNKFVYNLSTIITFIKIKPDVFVPILINLFFFLMLIVYFVIVMISRVEKFPYSDKDVTLKELTEALSKENFELYKQKKDKYFFRRIFSNKFSSAILPRLLVHYGVVVKFKQSVVVIMGLPTRIRRVKALVFGQSPSFPGFWQRFSAAFLDFCLIVVINALTVLLFGKFLALKYSIYFAVVTYLVLLWLYFSLLESSPLQATLGKYHVLGLKVTDTNGNRISFGRATARFWLKIISALPLFMGFIMVGLTKKKRALHDILSGCIVNYK